MGIDKRLRQQVHLQQFDKDYETSPGKWQNSNPNHWKLGDHFPPLVLHTMVDYRQRKYKIRIPENQKSYIFFIKKMHEEG